MAMEKPLVTVSGKKTLFRSDFRERVSSNVPEEGVEWKRRLDSSSRFVYIDVNFIDFSPDKKPAPTEQDSINTTDTLSIELDVEEEPRVKVDDANDSAKLSAPPKSPSQSERNEIRQQSNEAFFQTRLLGRPILHTYWADKTDLEGANQKSQFDDWIGQVQASSCTEWAIIIIEDGESASFLDRMKKAIRQRIGQSDSDRWLTLRNQDESSYKNFILRFRNILMASFSKQIELFEEQLRVQREMRFDEDFDFFSYLSMQEELANAFEFLTLYDEALVQYDLLDALFTEYISSPAFKKDPLFDKWTKFNIWPGLCLNLKSSHQKNLKRKIAEKNVGLLEMKNYIFAKQCDFWFCLNQPWQVTSKAEKWLQDCICEHVNLNIVPLSSPQLTCWSYISALEVLMRCECYTNDTENYSIHTVGIWNFARRKLIQLGYMSHRMPSMDFNEDHTKFIAELLSGLGPDPHDGVSYQKNEMSPQARLREALSGTDNFSNQLIEISELTITINKHIGRKRHALLVGKELADYYMNKNNFIRAVPFLVDMGRLLEAEKWEPLLDDVQKCISKCHQSNSETKESQDDRVLASAAAELSL